jgi:hypothetical protein
VRSAKKRFLSNGGWPARPMPKSSLERSGKLSVIKQ